MAEDNYFVYRVNEIRADNYTLKTNENNTKKAFIDEYYRANGKFTNEIKERIREYKLTKRGIIFQNCPDYKIEIIPDDVITTFLEIKKASQKDFIKFYKSYLNKIELRYKQEMIDNAFNDLKIAYHTYRMCNNSGWSCPQEFITASEMENLYKILNPEEVEKKENVIEIEIKQK